MVSYALCRQNLLDVVFDAPKQGSVRPHRLHVLQNPAFDLLMQLRDIEARCRTTPRLLRLRRSKVGV